MQIYVCKKDDLGCGHHDYAKPTWCAVALCSCSVLLQCVVAVCCCSVLQRVAAGLEDYTLNRLQHTAQAATHCNHDSTPPSLPTNPSPSEVAL